MLFQCARCHQDGLVLRPSKAFCMENLVLPALRWCWFRPESWVILPPGNNRNPDQASTFVEGFQLMAQLKDFPCGPPCPSWPPPSMRLEPRLGLPTAWSTMGGPLSYSCGASKNAVRRRRPVTSKAKRRTIHTGPSSQSGLPQQQ